MDKEDKQVDQVVDALLLRTTDLKNNIQQLICRLENEYETLQWPAVLDNFALISGQMSNLLKVLRSDKIPKLRNRIILPLLVSPDPDPELQRITEGRVPLFNHQAVPDYLRTLCDPEIEAADQAITAKASQMTGEATQKLIVAHNRISQNACEIIRSSRDDWDVDASSRAPPSCIASETTVLVSATLGGRSVRGPGPHGSGALGTNSPKPIGGPMGPGGSRGGSMAAPQSGGGKMPTATIKTNIKSGGGMSHPYMR
ncbi:mediator of RNA polymerase II transcription subunit 8 [Galendromus occidentalis]|uniref:Mediator of RNA polymerase II transcription subunit 8 n=1 Tax=Galendromus occidentalis TaxID=34638 RepID=A0AAJ6QS00_9ACAR|nr:mediator of RNA polymerase II transcription subunit 8 [Galendromus occidentalis]